MKTWEHANRITRTYVPSGGGGGIINFQYLVVYYFSLGYVDNYHFLLSLSNYLTRFSLRFFRLLAKGIITILLHKKIFKGLNFSPSGKLCKIQWY